MINSKIKNLKQLRRIVLKLKKQGKKIVFTNGCFDILHYGHAKYLEGAKKKGDCLIVAVNSDSSVRKIKGPKRPLIKEAHRLGLLASLESVDFLVLFSETTPIKVIKALQPNIMVKGADWKPKDIVGAGFVLAGGGKIATIKFVPRCSTSNIIAKIIKTHKK